MNERIRELAEQAQQYAEYVTPQGSEWLNAFKEKFAELIVRECMAVCDETQAVYIKYSKTSVDFVDKNLYAEGAAAGNCIKNKIMKRFGVEE
jgi:hypothetical protein